MAIDSNLFSVDPNSSELGRAPSLWALLQVPGIGSVTARRLAEVAATWVDLAEDSVAAIAGAGAPRVDPRTLAELALDPPNPPEGDVDLRLVGFFDADYPSALRDISNPPAVLWLRGTAPEGPMAAVVGTRHPTNAGLSRVQKVVSVLVSAGYGVVSGLAIGVDAAAHEATLKAGGSTWAYLGSGVDMPTPKANEALAERILEAGGGLLAEVDPGTRSSARTLVARDRLQSGTSSLTVIGQSGIPSGTLHTARFTIEQGRPLVVVAPPAGEFDEAAWAGNRALCDPEGCDPGILHASGGLADRISTKRPVADRVLSSASDLLEILK